MGARIYGCMTKDNADPKIRDKKELLPLITRLSSSLSSSSYHTAFPEFPDSLSHAICPNCQSPRACPLNFTQCLHKADVCKSSLVGLPKNVQVPESIKERR